MPPRLPTKIKQLRGTLQPCRENKKEPQVRLSIPDPPTHLDNRAIDEWNQVTKELFDLGIIGKIDRSALAAYCQSYAIWAEASDRLKEEGLVIMTTNGNLIQNPLLTIVNRSRESVRVFLREFGMTPASRPKVSVIGKTEKVDPWGAFD